MTRIADLRIHSIAIADPPLRSSYGLHAPYALRTIVELESEDGVVGLAETYGGEKPAAALRALKDQIVGRDAYRLGGSMMGWLGGSAAEASVGSSSLERSQTYLTPGENPLDAPMRTFAAIEVALLDLIGKTVGQPVCDLLGGRVRDSVAFSAYPFYKHAGGGGEGEDVREDEYGEALDAPGLVRQTRQMIEKYGFKAIKFKAGVLDPEIEIETVRQLMAEFGSGVPIRMDPNGAWSVETSIHVGVSLKEELGGGGYLEDPAASMEAMSATRAGLLKAGVDTPLASNVAVTCFADLPEAIRTDATQIVLCDHHYWGGPRQIQCLGRLLETFNLGMSMHSNSHLGISLMAMAHTAAATPHLKYDCDTHYPWQSDQDEVIVGGKLKIENGRVQISDKPGLGVELDPDRLARGKERFEKCPYRKRDDEAEMRKHVDPNWKRVLPRW